MVKSKRSQENVVDSRLKDEELWTLVTEIQDLVKVRAALSFGTRTATKETAESVLSRAINAKVNKLGDICIKKFDS